MLRKQGDFDTQVVTPTGTVHKHKLAAAGLSQKQRQLQPEFTARRVTHCGGNPLNMEVCPVLKRVSFRLW